MTKQDMPSEHEPPAHDGGSRRDEPTEGSLSRRRFLQSMGASSLAATGSGWAPTTAAQSRPAAQEDKARAAAEPGTQPVRLVVNGVERELNVPPNAVLLDVLRDSLLLTGTKKGCDHGQCGACTIHVNGVAVNSCLSLAVMHDGDQLTTVEGLESNGQLHPLQQAFWDHDAYQCGYCTSGQLMSALGVLQDARIPADDHALREAMSGNICRCGAYKNIGAAIQSVRPVVGRAG